MLTCRSCLPIPTFSFLYYFAFTGLDVERFQSAKSPKIPRVAVDFELSMNSVKVKLIPSVPVKPKIPLDVEEIAYGPACWMWDYLRRSGLKGFFLPLSGGADSASTATIVGTSSGTLFWSLSLVVSLSLMSHILIQSGSALNIGILCQMVVREIKLGNKTVASDAARIGDYPEGILPTDAKEVRASLVWAPLFLILVQHYSCT